MRRPVIYLLTAALMLLSGSKASGQRQMEYLDRGLIAMPLSSDSVYLGWRMPGTDPDNIAFNIYRQSGKAKAVRLNKKPVTESTNFIDASVNLLTENKCRHYYPKKHY